MNRNFEVFFQDVENPVAVSNVITAIATGEPIRAASLDGDILPCVVILAAVAKDLHGDKIVDDYEQLIHRQNEHIAHVMHPYKYLASGVVLDFLNGRNTRFDWPQAPYPFLRTVYNEIKSTEIPVPKSSKPGK